jgi:hypothetical protein
LRTIPWRFPFVLKIKHWWRIRFQPNAGCGIGIEMGYLIIGLLALLGSRWLDIVCLAGIGVIG